MENEEREAHPKGQGEEPGLTQKCLANEGPLALIGEKIKKENLGPVWRGADNRGKGVSNVAKNQVKTKSVGGGGPKK